MNAIELMFWTEVESDKATRRSLALCYAMLLACGRAGLKGDYWRPINEAVNAKLGLATGTQIDRWRKLAWDIYENMKAKQEPAS